MNKSKRGLIMAAGIIEILMAVMFVIVGLISLLYTSLIFDLFGALTEEIASAETQMVALENIFATIVSAMFFVIAFFQLLGAGLLLGSISKPENFANRHGRYVGGCVFTIMFTGVISIPAILLYISFAIKNEPKEVTVQTNS